MRKRGIPPRKELFTYKFNRERYEILKKQGFDFSLDVN